MRLVNVPALDYQEGKVSPYTLSRKSTKRYISTNRPTFWVHGTLLISVKKDTLSLSSKPVTIDHSSVPVP